MKKFRAFNYLNRWKALILVIAFFGSVGVYYYGSSSQNYTATAVIEYVGINSEKGLTPDGTAIDTSEIISAAVITDVISELGLSTNVETIRSGCSVKELIPAEEQQRKSVALEKNEEYEYYPTLYTITYNTNASADYARDVLDSILTNYYALYCEKYVDYVVFPSNAGNISIEKFDYIDCVTLLEKTVSDIVYYLGDRSELSAGFRSVATGYSFSDLSKMYAYIRDNELVGLHAVILDNKLVSDYDVLMRRYENDFALANLSLANTQEHSKEAWDILEQFGTKTLERDQMTYSFGGGLEENQGLISGSVQEGTAASTATTYDKLINQYVGFAGQEITHSMNAEYAQEMLTLYENASNTNPVSTQAIWAQNEIARISGELDELYSLVVQTVDEYNQNKGANNIAVRSSIIARANVNVNLYLMLAIVFFLCVGCFVAIFCGRMGDFVDYFMYTDSKTGLPNRNRCDEVIEKYEEHAIGESFVCMVFRVELQYPKHPSFTRKDGDIILDKFGGYMKHTLETMDFIGYNNDGMFVSFCENCSVGRAQLLADRLESAIENYNANGATFPISYTMGISESTTEKIYSARAILRNAIGKAMAKMRERDAKGDKE